VDASRISSQLAKARYEIERGNRDGARELTLEAEECSRGMTGGPDDRCSVYELLAARWIALGDDERAEPYILEMLELEASIAPRRPVTFGTRHLFYAKFLFERRRFAQAGIHARQGLELYAEGVEADDKELAYIRRLMAPVLRAAAEPAS
jgi:hypothetical protein